MIINIAAHLINCSFFIAICLIGCNNERKEKDTSVPRDYIKKIPGEDDSFAAEDARKGKILISYSDCFICHKEDRRSTGPAFRDIAERYPIKKEYIKYLAQKVISGGSGSWGYPVMSAHPKLSLEDAKMMVTYILSTKK